MRREISGGSAHPSGRRLPLPVDRDPLHRPERISPLPPRTCIQGRGLLMRKRTIVQRTDRDGVAGPIPSQNGGSDRATDRFASPEAMSQHALRPRLRIADLDPGVVCQVRLTLRRQRARCEGVCEHLARHWGDIDPQPNGLRRFFPGPVVVVRHRCPPRLRDPARRYRPGSKGQWHSRADAPTMTSRARAAGDNRASTEGEMHAPPAAAS